MGFFVAGWLDLDMVRWYLSLLLFIGLAWSQVEENIVLDISYYENGQKKHHRPYKDNIADGNWTYWYDNGQKSEEGIYKDGELISSKCWDYNGNEYDCGERDDDWGDDEDW